MVEMDLLSEERIERDRDDWPDRTTVDYLKDHVAKRPDKTAFIDPRSEYTFAELDKRSDRIAASLSTEGLGKADRVSVQLPNWNEFVLLRLALVKLGAVINPIPPSYRSSELKYILDLLESSGFVIPDEFDGFDYVSMARDELGFEGLIYTVAPDGGRAPEREGITPFADLMDDYVDTEGIDFPGLDPTYDLATVIFTSGTTGRPKGVMHTENTLNSSATTYVKRAQYERDSVTLMPSTLGHLMGYLFGISPPIISGATGVLMVNWVPENAVEMVDDLGLTHIGGATPFLHDFLKAENLDDNNTSSLDHFLCGGAPIPRPLLEDANEALDCSVYAGWGQTEDALVTMSRPSDPDEKIVGTDGCPMDNMEVKIIGSEDMEFPGDSGRILCRGPSLMTGFYGGGTEDSMLDDWYITGDVAEIDEDGYVSLTSREKDIIIRGGENIPVGKVEDVLHEHPKIDEVAIVAMPDDRLQERPCAYVKVVEGETFTIRDMTDYLDDRGVAQPFYPENIVPVQEFPRTPSGKIQKFHLREDIAHRFGRKPVSKEY